MRSSARLFCLPMLLAAVLAVSAAQTRQREARPRNCSISGRVTVGDKPAAKAKILVVEDHEDDDSQQPPDAPRVNKSYKVRADDDGRYRVASLMAGRYRVSVTSRADVPANESAKIELVKEVTLDDGEARENVDFTLVRGGVITGRVSDASDRPIIAQSMTLLRLDEKGNIPTERQDETADQPFETDDRGIYRFYGLRPGRYVVGVGGQDWSDDFSDTKRYPITYHPATTNPKQAKVIEVRAGDEVTIVDIRVNTAAKTFEATGRLIDSETGKPLPRVAVTAAKVVKTEDGQHDYWEVDSVSDNEGNFRLSGLTNGEYQLRAHFGGGIVSVPAAGESVGYYSEPARFQVGDEDVSGLTLKASRGASISGVAVIEGSDDPADKAKLTKIFVQVETIGAGESGEMQGSASAGPINTDGSFRVTGLAPGKARIQPWDFTNTGLRQLRIERDGAEANDGIEVRKGEQITGVRIVFGVGTSSIRGTVKITGGVLPEGWRLNVSARTNGKFNGAAMVDDKGRFVLSNLAEGEYEVNLVLAPDSSRTRGQEPPFPPLLQRVTLVKGAETQVTFELDLSKPQREREK